MISLVRSNLQGNIGFLKELERVNVMFTRARHGMIIIGNSQSIMKTKVPKA